MRASGWFTVAAGTYIGLVLLKDGTLGTLVQNASTFVQTGVKGLRPLTRIG